MDENKNGELQDAISQMVNAMGAAVEISGFLFKQLIANGFTRSEALEITKDYLLGMIKGDKK